MAGTVGKRIRTNRQGERQTTRFADYYDQHGQRRRKFFATKRAADDWLDNTRIEVKAGIHTLRRQQHHREGGRPGCGCRPATPTAASAARCGPTSNTFGSTSSGISAG